MQLHPSDFIYRKADNEGWIAEHLLLKLIPSLTKEYLRIRARVNYREKVSPCFRKNTFLPAVENASWRYGKTNGIFYYDYDFIPNKAPNYYAQQLPTLTQLVEWHKNAKLQVTVNPFETIIINALHNHKQNNHLYATYLPKQQITLSKAATVIEEIGKCFSQGYNTSKLHLFKQLSNLFVQHDVPYLPRHARSIQSLVKNYCAGKPLTELVKLKREANANAAVFVEDEEIKSWIISLRFSGKNFTNAHIIRKVQFMCNVTSKLMPSERWIGKVMEEANTRFITANGRWGANGRNAQEHKGYTPLGNALYAGDCWQVDGTRVNLINFKTKVTVTDDVTGREKALNKETFITIVAVRDVHSGEVLGRAYNLAENRWTYLQALKEAVQTAQYLPYEIVFDRFPGHNTPEFEAFTEDLENRGVKVTFTHKSEGKGKLERWFGTLQTVFMQDSDFFYGEGILSSRPFAHRSKEYLKELRKKANELGWNFDAATAEADKIIEAYRNTALSYYSRKFANENRTPSQIHEESEKPNVIELNSHTIHYLFGYKRKAKISNMGLIDFEVNRVLFNYRCADYNVQSKHNYVLISYMLEDMDTIQIYELTDKAIKPHLGTAELIPTIVPYGTNAFAGLTKQQAIIKEMETKRAEELQYKMAVGYDGLALLEQGGVNKGMYEEADERATMQLLTGSNDVDDFDDKGFDPREQY